MSEHTSPTTESRDALDACTAKFVGHYLSCAMFV